MDPVPTVDDSDFSRWYRAVVPSVPLVQVPDAPPEMRASADSSAILLHAIISGVMPK